ERHVCHRSVEHLHKGREHDGHRDQPWINARPPLVRERRCSIGTHDYLLRTRPIHSAAPTITPTARNIAILTIASIDPAPSPTVTVGTTDIPGPRARCTSGCSSRTIFTGTRWTTFT